MKTVSLRFFCLALNILLFIHPTLIAHAQPGSPHFDSHPVNSGTYNEVYTYNITTRYNGLEQLQIFLSDGTLPGGLSLTDNNDGTGIIVGNLTQAGDFPIQLTVQETGGLMRDDTQSFTISVSKATATVSLGNLEQVYDGSPKSVTVSTSPEGLGVDVTYNGSASPPINAGNYPVVAVINDLNYKGSASDNLIIDKITPVVTWSNPAPINYPAPLDATQLNASANVPGSFTYHPPAGTVLHAGADQALSVDFTPDDQINYSQVNGTATMITVNKATPVVSWSNPDPIGYGTPLGSTQLNAAANVPGSFSYTPAAGTILNVGVNTLSADFQPSDAIDYNAVTGTTVSITVQKATPVVTWSNPAPIMYGTPLSATQLNAHSNVPGTFVYAPSSGTILNAGPDQLLSANFTPADEIDYNHVNGTTVYITVNKATPVITWAHPNPIEYGTPLSNIQLNATANFPGTFSYSPPSGTVLNVGTWQLHASFTPAHPENYNSIPDTSVPLQVQKATPVITWPKPKAITYGTAIGATQLNAQANVAGFYLYNPGTGTRFDAGTHTLSLTFWPQDLVDYKQVTVTNNLVVNKAMLKVTADNQQRDYGTKNPAFTFAYNGFITGENAAVLDKKPVASSTGTKASHAGSYDINVSGGADNNYDFNYISGTLTINKIILTATARDTSREYGMPNPVFAVDYKGFVNGDTPDSLQSPPVGSSVATETSDVGTYAIELSGGSAVDYNFDLHPGTLTVVKGVASITFGANVFTYDGTAKEAIATTDPAGLQLIFSYEGLTGPPVEIGTYQVTATVDDKNYSGTASGQMLIKNPPSISDFSVMATEDQQFPLILQLFNDHYTDDPFYPIAIVRIVTLPKKGIINWHGNTVNAGDDILVEDGSLQELVYIPTADFNGSDSFDWNASDGSSFSSTDATISLTVSPVNDPPVLNIADTEPLTYKLGDPPILIAPSATISDVDNAYIYSASITITENFSKGDVLSIDQLEGSEVTVNYKADSGRLMIKGKASKSYYETIMSTLKFSSSVTGEATLSDKKIEMVVSDSLEESQPVFRIVRITQLFPDLSIVNAFTPNGDGVNDNWDILNLEFYKAIKVAVYSQNGVRVFDCVTPDCKWDGRYKGHELPAGPYFYTIDVDSGKRKYQGIVTILK